MWAKTLDTCQDPSDYAYCTCAVYSCGYSQPPRDWLTLARLEAGTAETDCSYGVGQWLTWGGYLDENPGFHTAIEREYLTAHGFEAIDANAGFVSMQRNDVLLRDRNDALGILGHTALYIGDGYQAEALRDENHDAGYEGTTPGDQDGGETVVRRLTSDWDWVLRKIEAPTPKPTIQELISMTFLFTSGGNHRGKVYYYDGGKIWHVKNSQQQTEVKKAYKMACGKDMPFFYLENGDQLFALVCSSPVTE